MNNEQKIESELAVFWQEMADNLPKSIERSALGDEKIFVAFKASYLKMRNHWLKVIADERARLIEDILHRTNQYTVGVMETGALEMNDLYQGRMSAIHDIELIIKSHKNNERHI